MKVLFYGAGVLGSLYAARLQGSGQDVLLLARGQRLSDLHEHGIVLEDGGTGRQTATHVTVVEQLAPDDAYDLVVVLVGRHQVGGVLPVLAANERTPNVLFMFNNAAGPDQMIEALGRERVLLGFPGAAGQRERHIVRYIVMSSREQATTVGELGGETTVRLKSIAGAFEQAGFPVDICPNMDAWLKTHAVEIIPTAGAFYMTGSDISRLAGSRDAIVLMIRAIREGYEVLRTLGAPVTPSRHRVFGWLPEPLLVFLIRKMVKDPTAQLKMGHARAAVDEMMLVADEFRGLARQSSVLTPAMDRLSSCVEVAAASSRQAPMDLRALSSEAGADKAP